MQSTWHTSGLSDEEHAKYVAYLGAPPPADDWKPAFWKEPMSVRVLEERDDGNPFDYGARSKSRRSTGRAEWGGITREF